MAHSQLIFPKAFTAPQAVCAGYPSQFTVAEDSDLQEELLTIAFFVLKVFVFLAIVLWPWQVAR
jgi:hypothetical protein